MKRSKKIFVAVGAAAGLAGLTACGYSTPSDMVAVQVGSGPFEASKIKGCIDPGKRQNFLETNDKYVMLPGPSNQREWDATGQNGSDSPAFQSVTGDNVLMNMPVTVRFTLKGDCENLKAFYVNYVRRYGAEFHSDGSYNDQWVTVLRKLVADPADATLDRIVQAYKWREVWNNPTIKVEIEKKLADALRSDDSLMTQTAKAAYFDGISVIIGQPAPANGDLAAAVALEQTQVAKAQSEQAQAAADRAKAEAQVAVAEAEAKKKAAEIKGYGSVEDYLKSQMIERGLNPFQPSYGAALTPVK